MPPSSEIRGRSCCAVQQQPCARAGEAKKIENIRLRSVRDAAHRVGEFVQRNADQQVRVDVGRKGCTAVIRGGIVRAEQPEQLELCIPDRDTRLPLNRRSARQRVEGRVARRGVVDQVRPKRRIADILAVIRSGSGAAAGSAIVDV